ncbi:hypothetical protein GQ44DRAFT_198131, partial [Phaeosphaeriaceae sp. PMI808]
MALGDFPDEWILRVISEQYKLENLLPHEERSGNVVHFATWINYYKKTLELTFYNDKYGDYILLKPKLRSRQRPKTETPEEFELRITEWEARKAREQVITKPGNSMRAKYYVDKILPVYCEALHQLERRSDELRPHVCCSDRYN